MNDDDVVNDVSNDDDAVNDVSDDDDDGDAENSAHVSVASGYGVDYAFSMLNRILSRPCGRTPTRGCMLLPGKGSSKMFNSYLSNYGVNHLPSKLY